ncbi:hypothetical protein Leryth_021759 [Lithospermum erythrorhizon]|nr:hypothetical protein Leryth_021759 [Lithospermum erythrorhizon]
MTLVNGIIFFASELLNLPLLQYYLFQTISRFYLFSFCITVHREIINEEESGVEGILNRLQRERNSSLGFDMGRNGHGPLSSSGDEGDHWDFRTSTSAGGTKNGASSGGYHSHHSKPNSWKGWTIQRAGAQITKFEAAEISYKLVENKKVPPNSDRIAASKSLYGLKEIKPGEIQTRLKQLESELSSALHSLRFVKEGSLTEKGKVSSSSELENLYDSWEFQENEVIHAKEKLRVIHAKLAVLKGKRSLLIGKSENIEMLNQRRLEGARKALQLLRQTRIVWQNSASQVFLTGSYDGWTSQRKMEKSSSGFFCASLRLYPGRYEVDPRRPIVHNDGYANNLLIIT